MLKLSDINGKTPDFMRAINEFVANPKGFFIMAGYNGNGKTFSAQAIFDHFWRQWSDNKFYNQVDLNLEWQKKLKDYGDTTYLLSEIVKSPLLVLDDIGTRPPSPAFMDFLYAIADKRYRSRDVVGTIITTNLTTDAMRECFGDAFVSRVSSGICVRNNGLDRRAANF